MPVGAGIGTGNLVVIRSLALPYEPLTPVNVIHTVSLLHEALFLLTHH